MGLGLLGRGVGDVNYLAQKGADLIVTDLKSKEELKESFETLQAYEGIQYRLGGHRMRDFQNRDMILKAAGVASDSPYIKEAKKNHIPVEMDETLFIKLAPNITTIGITGTRGKTTTTHLIYEILKRAGKPVHLAGNIAGRATLPLLDTVKEGDYVVLELSSWQLQGFGEHSMSPQISVFTNFMPDHMNYYRGCMDTYLDDKANIFKYQNKQDHLILGEKVSEIVRRTFPATKSNIRTIREDDIPDRWHIKIPGEHNRENIALAIVVAKTLGVRKKDVQGAVENFGGVEHRLQLIRDMDGIRIYNDTTATTPDATLAGLKALSEICNKGIILIIGGTDKGLDMSKLVEALPHYSKTVILLSGTGTEKFKTQMSKRRTIKWTEAPNLKEAIDGAMHHAVKNDIILFSPAFASFGMFKNEFDRGDRFCELVKMRK